MALSVKKVDVWQGSVADEPGTLSQALGALTEAGADLAFTLARRDDKTLGSSIVFVAPLRGVKQARAAAKAGFRKSSSLQAIRVEGGDRPGLAADITGALGDAGVNIRGFSASVSGKRVVAYIALDREQSVAKAAKALRTV